MKPYEIMRYNIGEKIVIKCPVCSKVYSYGRMISHLCDGGTFFFGAIFNERTPEYQWNCWPHPIMTRKPIHSLNDFPTSSDFEKVSRRELLSDQKNSNILYPWNCHSNQNELSVLSNLTISDKKIIYE